ncbi:hypothetical protein ABZ611_06055 [Streptomyces sp. NPDC007861]|uniref:hypothetical protein n=1 Tax=Streptomyces sp. NPDC007861 TaxID=3154893 RepID=UPI0033D219F9
MGRRRTAHRAAAAVVVAAALLSGCGPESSPAGGAGEVSDVPSVSTTPPLTAAATPSATPSPSAPVSATPQTGPSGYEGSAAPSARPVTPTAKPKAPSRPTKLTMFASAPGGRLDLARGGPAKEFTVSVHNGNTRAYAEVAVAFQMEIMESANGRSSAQNGFVVERRDPATGRWTNVELRVANDVQPLWLTATGSPLALEASRVERYRIRAVPTGPAGSMPLLIKLVDAAAPDDAWEAAFLGNASLMVSAKS